MPTRTIIHIDEAKCTGCGACIVNCAEGALAIVDGKARIVRDSFCDGLGACLGHCPEGALTLIEREAEPFDEEAALAHAARAAAPLACGCPGSHAMTLHAPAAAPEASAPAAAASALGHWPVKLRLIPESAPFLRGASLLLLADCAAAASPALHRQFLPGRAVALACPKFEEREANREKLARILGEAGIRDLTVLEMEVPCCAGLSSLAAQAIGQAQCSIPARRVILAREGSVLREEPLARGL
ncbi:4Fe-4S ferredoxin [Thermodesulfomicrobium sp. WS]|uniref:ATP-binding protein n=1 Tax=Thermodesulfomicrobium sp. WS TaxID=3004129 RepID=UPI00249089AB|nr:4Fe-4S dicluster domain-containing protein [Thermodesulfomicrobium sp. WS]BDV01985.1 4Fe-4S ferredoxin [Thermodesulfomicrobium sp. WS]